MKKNTTTLIVLLIGVFGFSQTQFHVTANAHKTNGNGSLKHPWDLQTALSQKPGIVKGSDTIWLHEGVYSGRFISTLESNDASKKITVAAFNEDLVILNGNIQSDKKAVLEVRGKNVIYKNFEVTYRGEFSRNQKDSSFTSVSGVSHTNGEDCEFYNLRIHDVPGSGFGSWKFTGGSLIQDCVIYNNGYQSKNGRGSGVGLYIQNASEKQRMIKGNSVFNNYYKGIEVWSDNKRATNMFVKNITLQENVIFNNGSPSGAHKDNLIVATNDNNGVNIATNIRIFDNVLYHNTNVQNGQINGDAASLTIGFNENAPVKDVVVKNNVIIGRNNALRLLYANTLIFENNDVYCGYVHLQSSILSHIPNWKFDKNRYFTKRAKAFRIIKNADYSVDEWKSNFKLDASSKWANIKNFELKQVLGLCKMVEKKNAFKIVLYSESGDDVLVDFSEFNIKKGSQYKIYDIENPKKVFAFGKFLKSEIAFKMKATEFEMPLHNTLAQKTLNNFGVFIIEFDK